MKLSEAIRLGAMLGPQCFGEYFSDDGGSCALGAARLARGLGVEDELDTSLLVLALEDSWGLHDVADRVACPSCRASSCSLHDAITHLNDGHRWTREQIADWVESVEQAHESTPVTVEAVTA